VRRVFRLPLTRRRVSAEVDAELRFHLEGRIEELAALGMPRDAAAAEARRRFGDLDTHRRQMRAIDEETLRMRRRRDLMDTLGREPASPCRMLARSKTFTVMTVPRWRWHRRSRHSRFSTASCCVPCRIRMAIAWCR
jgi:hypothetical protein